MPNDASLLLDDADPTTILVETLAMFERVCLASSLGPQSLVVIDLLAGLGHRVPVLFLDTGAHFPETIDFLGQVEHRWGLTIERVRPPEVVAGEWAVDADACCARRKVEPLRRALRGYDAWITGIRRDQTEHRSRARAVDWDGRFGLWKVNPMVRWDRARVEAYHRAHRLPAHPLWSQGYASVGCAPCTAPGVERDGRWAGTGKTECGLHLPPREAR
jgi:phosphoadenosine phosphosulfate reductase